MESEEIVPYDWDRILFGNVPPIFLLEIVLRAIFLFTLLLVALRLTGKRMAMRMTRNELAAIATVSAAIGLPMQTPDRGLLPALVIVAFVVAMQRWVAGAARSSEKLERRLIGRISTVVENGVLQMDELRKSGISRDRVLSVLRTSGIRQLGEVQRLYLEATGGFSLVKAGKPAPGMPVIPDWDKDFLKEMQVHRSVTVCQHCGYQSGTPFDTCKNCGHPTPGPAYA